MKRLSRTCWKLGHVFPGKRREYRVSNCNIKSYFLDLEAFLCNAIKVLYLKVMTTSANDNDWGATAYEISIYQNGISCPSERKCFLFVFSITRLHMSKNKCLLCSAIFLFTKQNNEVWPLLYRIFSYEAHKIKIAKQ